MKIGTNETHERIIPSIACFRIIDSRSSRLCDSQRIQHLPSFIPGQESPVVAEESHLLARDLCFDAFAVLHSGIKKNPSADYDGTVSPEAYWVGEAIQERLREHIVATDDMRLFGLLHLLGQASLRIEQVLWPEEYDRMTRDFEERMRSLAVRELHNSRTTIG